MRSWAGQQCERGQKPLWFRQERHEWAILSALPWQDGDTHLRGMSQTHRGTCGHCVGQTLACRGKDENLAQLDLLILNNFICSISRVQNAKNRSLGIATTRKRAWPTVRPTITSCSEISALFAIKSSPEMVSAISSVVLVVHLLFKSLKNNCFLVQCSPL